MSRLLYSHALERPSALGRLHPMTMLIALASFVVIVGARLPLRETLSVLLVVAPMSVFIVLLQGFARTTNIIYSAKVLGIGIELSGDGVRLGMLIAARIVLLSIAMTTFFIAVSPVKLTRALYEAHVPFKFAYLVTLALRFLPLMIEELNNINNAQKSRGYDIDRVNPIIRGFKVFPLMVPLIMLSLRRASAIALAMDLRAFNARPERTFYVSLEKRPVDTWVRVGAVGLAVLFLLRAVVAAFGGRLLF